MNTDIRKYKINLSKEPEELAINDLHSFVEYYSDIRKIVAEAFNTFFNGNVPEEIEDLYQEKYHMPVSSKSISKTAPSCIRAKNCVTFLDGFIQGLKTRK